MKDLEFDSVSQYLLAGESILWGHKFDGQLQADENEQSFNWLLFAGFLLLPLLVLASLFFMGPEVTYLKFAAIVGLCIVLFFGLIQFLSINKAASQFKKLTYLVTDQRILVIADDAHGAMAYEDIYDLSVESREDGNQVLYFSDKRASQFYEKQEYKLLIGLPTDLPSPVFEAIEGGVEFYFAGLPDLEEVMAIIEPLWLEKSPYSEVLQCFKALAERHGLNRENAFPNIQGSENKLWGKIGKIDCLLDLNGFEELYMEFGLSKVLDQKLSIQPSKDKLPQISTNDHLIGDLLAEEPMQKSLVNLYEEFGGKIVLKNKVNSSPKEKMVEDNTVLDTKDFVAKPVETENQSWLLFTFPLDETVPDYQLLSKLIKTAFETSLLLAQKLGESVASTGSPARFSR